jgi:hypothetical protein
MAQDLPKQDPDQKVPFEAPTHSPGEDSKRPMATIQDDDERLLARIGYHQVPFTLPAMKSELY